MSPAADADQAPAAEPRVEEADGAPRIASLDVVRGVAILGILFMNINEMGGSLWASFDDIRHFGWTPADRTVWWLREVAAEGTARGLLQLLFGAGMLILTDRATKRADGASVVGRYLLRNLVLLGFGLAHLFLLLWPGDILHTYAIAAMIVVFARRLRPRAMLMLGLSTTILYLLGGGLAYLDAQRQRSIVVEARAGQVAGRPLTRPEVRALADVVRRDKERATTLADRRARIAQEDAARTGDARSWAGSAWATIAALGGAALEVDIVWEAAAAMLVGAALYRWGILQGERSRRFYAGLALAGYSVGLPLRIWSAAQTMRFDGAPNIDMATYELARLTTTLGHLGLLHLALATALGARALRPFAAAGRTALSIYILQTLACLWLLYPPFALGLYGRQAWTELMATALAIDLVLLAAANWWTRRYPIAPVEWAWRSIVEGRRLPFRPG